VRRLLRRAVCRQRPLVNHGGAHRVAHARQRERDHAVAERPQQRLRWRRRRAVCGKGGAQKRHALL
jgi:hypothetical protein